MAEVDLIYKISILNLLNKADFDMTDQQITSFFIDYKYTDYFTIQKNISDLAKDALIASDDSGPAKYHITDAGEETLKLLSDRLTPAIRRDTRDFFDKNSYRMKQSNIISAKYDGNINGGYTAHLKYSDDGSDIFDLMIHTSTKDQAEALCLNFREKYMDVYSAVMETLL